MVNKEKHVLHSCIQWWLKTKSCHNCHILFLVQPRANICRPSEVQRSWFDTTLQPSFCPQRLNYGLPRAVVNVYLTKSESLLKTFYHRFWNSTESTTSKCYKIIFFKLQISQKQQGRGLKRVVSWLQHVNHSIILVNHVLVCVFHFKILVFVCLGLVLWKISAKNTYRMLQHFIYYHINTQMISCCHKYWTPCAATVSERYFYTSQICECFFYIPVQGLTRVCSLFIIILIKITWIESSVIWSDRWNKKQWEDLCMKLANNHFTQYHFCNSGQWSKGFKRLGRCCFVIQECSQRGVKYQELSLSWFQRGDAALGGQRYFSHMQSYKKRRFLKETSIFIGSKCTCDLNVYCKLFCEAAAPLHESYNSAFIQTLPDFDKSQCSTQIIQNKLRYFTGEILEK